MPASVERLPEPFDLRQWFRDDLASFARATSEPEQNNLERAIDVEGAVRFATPRNVVRALNGVRFAWSGLRGQVDLGDLVWLQIVRASNLDLYRWLEEYLANFTVRHTIGAALSSDEEHRSYERLAEIVGKEGRSFYSYQNNMSEYVPGLSYTLSSSEPGKIYQEAPQREIDAAILGKRLASPEHYRLYFAMSAPVAARLPAGA